MTPLARVIVEKNGIMNVREGYLDENGDEEDTRHDSGEEDEVCVEKRKTDLKDLPLDVLRLIFAFSEATYSLRGHHVNGMLCSDLVGYTLTGTNRHFHSMRRHMYWKLNRQYSVKYNDNEDFRTNLWVGCMLSI